MNKRLEDVIRLHQEEICVWKYSFIETQNGGSATSFIGRTEKDLPCVKCSGYQKDCKNNNYLPKLVDLVIYEK